MSWLDRPSHPGARASQAIVERFGSAVLDPDGALDRSALAAVVFSDPQARRDLEQIVHPAVYAAIRDWLEELPRARRWRSPTSPCYLRLATRLTSIASSSWPARQTSNCAA